MNTIKKKRIVIKPGDIFEYKYGAKKRFFQFMTVDRNCLNGDVIRCFKKEYAVVDSPDPQEIVKDEVLIYLQTGIYAGRAFNLWERIGNVAVDHVTLPYFRATDDVASEVDVSDKWYIWKPNGKVIKVGRLTDEIKSYPTGGVIHPLSVPEILRTGKNPFRKPG